MVKRGVINVLLGSSARFASFEELPGANVFEVAMSKLWGAGEIRSRTLAGSQWL
jgi:hypothetical protein